MKNKNIRLILGLVLCIIGIIWLVPTIFVTTAKMRISDYKIIQSDAKTDTFEISYSFEKNGVLQTATYHDTMLKGVTPKKGEQGVCHYFNFPPYTVLLGDAKSPVPPLVCILAGILILFIKKEKSNQNDK